MSQVSCYSPRTMTTAEEEAFRRGSTAFNLTCHVMSCHLEQRLYVLIVNSF